MLNVKSLIKSAKDHEFLFFWQISQKSEYSSKIDKSCLSQWYPSSFFEDGQFYNCAEQYMMAQKARLMGDKEIEQEIMLQTDPKKMKGLGKKVKRFDNALWNKHKVDIVIRGNKLKFSQNPQLGEFLLSTGDKVLVEASPYDDIWGIGLKETDSIATNPSLWRGENLLGFSLMEVREWLSKEKEEIAGEVCCGVTPKKVICLKRNEIFVFGSNLGGRHDGGAAAYALENFWAEWGEGIGLHRRSYAIPTMHGGVESIRPYVDQFIKFASENPEYRFLVTKIGCGIAGFKVEEIAPLFAKAVSMRNVSLPQEFIDVICPQRKGLTKEDKKVLMMWTMGLGNSAKAFAGEDPMPSKKEIATAQSWDVLPMPYKHTTVTLNHTIPTKDMNIVRCGHIPSGMEDHWFMYCDNHTIRYYRSWTGFCIFVAEYEIKDDKTLITNLKINRDKEQYSSTDDKKDTLLFQYLLTAEYGGDAMKYWKMMCNS